MYSKKWIFGKNVVITGTSSGIGLELAKLLSSKYFCDVYGCGRNLQKLENSKKVIDEEIEIQYKMLIKKNKNPLNKGSYNFFQADVSSFESFAEFKNKLDMAGFKPDIVINNAGIMPAFEKFETESVETARKVFDTNFFSHVYSYKLFVDILKENHGAFYSISSSSALCPIVGQALYSASKAAIKNFIESIRLEQKNEFLIGLIFPGYVATDLFRNEENISKLVKSFSMHADKMARKIVNVIRKRKKRSVLGFDGILMNSMYKFFPKSSPKTISNVLELSHDKMFDKVFENNNEKRKNKNK